MRSALEKHATTDAETVGTFTMGRKVADLRGHALIGAFNGAAQLARLRNNQRSRSTIVNRRTGDFSKVITPADINQRNAEYWDKRKA